MMSGLLRPLISRTSTMPDHRCACPDALDRCDRCDFLLDFLGLHLVAVSKARAGLVLEVESCDPVAGCPGCGVIATGDGRVGVEVIDAPWAGRPVRIRWRKRRWICLEGVCAVTTFVEQSAGLRSTGPAKQARCPLGDRPAPARGGDDPGPGPPARHDVEHALVPGSTGPDRGCERPSTTGACLPSLGRHAPVIKARPDQRKHVLATPYGSATPTAPWRGRCRVPQHWRQ